MAAAREFSSDVIEPAGAVVKQARIAFLSAYFGMYDDVMPAGFREHQLTSAAHSRAVLSAEFDVVDLGMIATEAEGRAAGELLRATPVDAIVYAPTMVAPPAWPLQVLAGRGAPVIIWNAVQVLGLEAELDHPHATINTTQVGCLMLANVLRRQRRWSFTVTGSPLRDADNSKVLLAVRAAATAGSLLRAVALRIGEAIPGYDDVMTSPAELAAIGVTERTVQRPELDAAFDAVDDASAQHLLDELKRRPHWHVGEDENAQASARLALALEALCVRHGATCGTINCHGDLFRNNPNIGIAACLGMSLMGERGIPLSCTGDLPAGLAMAVAERLSGRALYCETYTPDLTRGTMLIASGGDGDPRWADHEGIRTIANAYYSGKRGAGTGVTFRLAPGPATLISMSPAGAGWRLIWATGEVTEDGYDGLDGPNGMFRFDRGPIEDAASAWIASGATHHHALAGGRLDTELRIVAAAAGFEAVAV
jgi:L-arabinose isomerase